MFRIKFLIALALFSLLPLVFLGLPDRTVQGVKSMLNRVTVPMLKVSHDLFEKADDFFDGVLNFEVVRDENRRLKEDLARATLELARLKDSSLEHERLKKLLGFVEGSPWRLVGARVVARSPSRWRLGLWIDRGHASGLKEGMAVLTQEGVVGKVTEVMRDWSRVMLLTDENCHVGALVEESREMGVLQGGSSDCILNYLPRQARAKTGDAVVSSGLSAFFPGGIPMGRISKVQDDAYGLFQYAKVEPVVRFAQLEEVMVMISEEKPIEGEQDFSREGSRAR